jgi:hypothetical protein
MAPIIETPSRQPADEIEPGVRSRDDGDVPGQMVALVASSTPTKSEPIASRAPSASSERPSCLSAALAADLLLGLVLDSYRASRVLQRQLVPHDLE